MCQGDFSFENKKCLLKLSIHMVAPIWIAMRKSFDVKIQNCMKEIIPLVLIHGCLTKNIKVPFYLWKKLLLKCYTIYFAHFFVIIFTPIPSKIWTIYSWIGLSVCLCVFFFLLKIRNFSSDHSSFIYGSLHFDLKSSFRISMLYISIEFCPFLIRKILMLCTWFNIKTSNK